MPCTALHTLFAELTAAARAHAHAQAAGGARQRTGLAALLERQAAARTAETGSRRAGVSPFERMQHCRDALDFLDTKGWNRSYHQRLFHEDFLVSHGIPCFR